MSHTHTELLTDIERYDTAIGDTGEALTVRVTLDMTMDYTVWARFLGTADDAAIRDLVQNEIHSVVLNHLIEVAPGEPTVILRKLAAVEAVKRANNLFPKAGA